MASDDPKTIEIQVRIPVYVRLKVTWDADEEAAVVHGGEITPFQVAITERLLFENMSDDERQQLDLETLRAFGRAPKDG